MINKIVTFGLICFISALNAQDRSISSKINALGAGYGVEYFFSPNLSLHSEFGLSYWEKVNDKIQGTDRFTGIAPLNPYLSGSLRYFIRPIRKTRNENYEIGWRLSTTYTGLYTIDEAFRFSGKNILQMGIFAGASFCFARVLYLDVELGPGYSLSHFDRDGAMLLGNIGAGLIF